MDKIEEKLWNKVYRFVNVMQAVPFVKMIAVCNNLAFGIVDEESDIDIFVVAKKKRLFIARLFLVFYLHITGVRRHGKKVAGRFCLSFFVDESHLNLSKLAIKNDIYFAYWIYKLVPIINRGVLYEFEMKNRWILPVLKEESFRNKRSDIKKAPTKAFLSRKFFEFILFGPIGNVVEKFIGSWQMKRAKEKAEKLESRAGTVIADNVLKFHDADKRLLYRDAYSKIVEKGADGFDEPAFISVLKKSL